MKNLSRPVCAGVTVLSFRQNLDELVDEFWKNAENSYALSLEDKGINTSAFTDKQWKTGATEFFTESPLCDLQILFSKTRECFWSAPKQDLLDGALFFYLGNRALTNVHRCVRQAKNENWREDSPFMRSLLEAAQFIENNAGSVIGVAKVLSIPGPGSGPGFRRRVFAEIDLENFYHFANPLPYKIFQNICPIYGQTVVALVADKANWLRNELGKSNELPLWLTDMTFGESKYSGINAENWMEKISAPHIFIEDNQRQEETIRAYFLNFLINEIKEDGSCYYEECNTWRNSHRTGRVDYFFKIHGEWVPFEAKVAVNTEPDIYSQIRQYINIDHFDYNEIRSDGKETTSRKGSQKAGNHKVCLIGDQFGIYLTQNASFINCSLDKPLWARTELSKAKITEVKETLKHALR
jgi:hypothetical protein